MNKDFCTFIHQTIFFKNFRKRFLLIDEFKFLVHKEFPNCMRIISCRLSCVITGIENTICPSFVKFLVLAENVFLLGDPQLPKISCDGPFGINIFSVENRGKGKKYTYQRHKSNNFCIRFILSQPQSSSLFTFPSATVLVSFLKS